MLLSELYQTFGIFVPLIIVNCLVIGLAATSDTEGRPFRALWAASLRSGSCLGELVLLLPGDF
ncbi:MAG: hypothetical protein H0Z38_09470 [Firmicutes bacterium]|nr:hypothetical protein [Bacillota bacterium]